MQIDELLRQAKSVAPRGPWTFTATDHNTGLMNTFTTDKIKKAAAFLRVHTAFKHSIHMKGKEEDTTPDGFREMLLRTLGDVGHFLVAADGTKIVRTMMTHSVNSEFTIEWCRTWGTDYSLMAIGRADDIRHIEATGELPLDLQRFLKTK